MATCSTITVKMNDGSFNSITCHYDGYVGHVGAILFELYSSQEKAEKLVAMGDLRCLGRTSGGTHSFHSLGEDLVVHKTSRDPRKFSKAIYAEEYNYLWDGSDWFVATEDDFAHQKWKYLSCHFESEEDQ